MSKTISIVSRKGGVGKSTICSNLAVLAVNAMVLDCDDQATLADWGDRRSQRYPQVISIAAKRAAHYLQTQKTEWNFIDTPGTLDAGVIEVMKASDFVLVVLRYGQFELDSVSTTLSAIQVTGKPAAIVLNHLHPNAKASELIKDLETAGLGIPIAPIAIRLRTDFQNAAVQGMGVTELSKSSKASQEIMELWQWLQEIINL
ncbi:ParA family protein [Synechocystis salina LEGE 06155]|nr:ParA family protein [Synechocystis salina LEGE 06155]